MLFLHLDLHPVVASRPRLSVSRGRFGRKKETRVHHAAKYARFQKQAGWMVRTMVGRCPDHRLREGAVIVVLRYVIKKPLKTKLKRPRGDIDNYEKALLDACTGAVWVDDDQVEECHHRKDWERPDLPAGIYMAVFDEEEYEQLPSPRTLSPLWKQGRAGPV
jgi:Holliday junction resolvase RusA-like endonuclease